ncbi:MAG TPA: hypothetical protein VG993_08440 [Actinomycetota bacterium]|jgi:hypothetical protein|nr:hypothetical protein [Actinomycetota bacterium]
MRRTTPTLVAALVILAAACSSTVDGPASPAPAAELRGAPALLQAQVRAATLRFVEAYRATVLGGNDLRGMAATPLMRRFAYWLGVTNRSFPGEITATSMVGAVGPAIGVGGDGQALEVDVSAQVDVIAQPTQGDPLEFSVPLDGPVRFAAAEPGAWRVIDFVRFGVPVSGAFVPLDLDFRRPAVRFTLDSFGGVPNWSFFVRVSATGPRVLTLDESDVTLVDADGKVVGEAIEVSAPLLEVAPGGRIDGALSFEPLQDVRGISLRIDLAGARDPAPLEIPLSAVTRAGD